ncbi:hypothetical protein QQP08_024023 [Theobroma cacao]|nr:hypothetical protein QQP08_024023 [Theobroma cacao]
MMMPLVMKKMQIAHRLHRRQRHQQFLHASSPTSSATTSNPPHPNPTQPFYISSRSSSIDLDEDEEEQEHDDAISDEEYVEQIGNKT